MTDDWLQHAAKGWNMNKWFFSADICLRRGSSVAFKSYFSSNKSIITLNPQFSILFFFVIHTTRIPNTMEGGEKKKKLSWATTNVELIV